MRNAFALGALLCLAAPAAPPAEAQTSAGYVAADGADADELVAVMKRSNLELQAARQRLAQAEGRLRQRGLWLNPRLELDDKSDRLAADRGARELEFALVQPVELGGKRAARIRLGEAEREMVRFEIADLERRFAADLRLRIGDALAAAARLQALDDALELRQKIQRAVVLRVSAGDASRFEMALSEAETARLDAERQTLLSQLENVVAGIKMQIGMVQSAALLLREQALGQDSRPVRQEATLIEQALAARPDLQAAHWRAIMAQSGLRLAEANAFPDVGILVGFKQEQSARESGVNGGLSPGSNWLLRFGVTTALPLFNRNQGGRQESAALLAETRLASDFAEQAVRRDVHVALRRLELAENSLRLVRTRLLPQTETAARIARTGYDLGELSLQQLLLEQRRVIEARGALIDAGLEAYRARVELVRATAEGSAISAGR